MLCTSGAIFLTFLIQFPNMMAPPSTDEPSPESFRHDSAYNKADTPDIGISAYTTNPMSLRWHYPNQVPWVGTVTVPSQPASASSPLQYMIICYKLNYTSRHRFCKINLISSHSKPHFDFKKIRLRLDLKLPFLQLHEALRDRKAKPRYSSIRPRARTVP